MQIALSMMRMAADNTYLVDKKTVHGPKIEELAILLRELILEGGEKVVIFSQWLRMTELVERVLQENGIAYVHLNGMVPSKDRKELMTRFREDRACMVFLSTDAGGVGLNLQSGSVVINMDIPWNPAVLEQRIGRVHRLGQRRSVRVINFVTKASIEERILDLLKFKKSLFAGALDEGGENVVMIGESQLKKFMQTVETVTGGLEKPDPLAETEEKIEIARDMAAMDREEDEGEKEMEGAPLSAGAGAMETLETGSLGHIQAMIGKDETTGKAYLKIPLPGPETVQGILTALGGLLAGVFAKRQDH